MHYVQLLEVPSAATDVHSPARLLRSHRAGTCTNTACLPVQIFKSSTPMTKFLPLLMSICCFTPPQINYLSWTLLDSASELSHCKSSYWGLVAPSATGVSAAHQRLGALLQRSWRQPHQHCPCAANTEITQKGEIPPSQTPGSKTGYTTGTAHHRHSTICSQMSSQANFCPVLHIYILINKNIKFSDLKV